MKALRFIGMALLATMVSINFTSCNKDEEGESGKNDDGIITNQKRLVEIGRTNGKDTKNIYFTYDSKDRMIAVSVNRRGKEVDNYFYAWGNNVIMATSSNDDEDESTYMLTDNLVRKQQYSNTHYKTFMYNSSNQLINLNEKDDSDSDNYTFTWNSQKLTQCNNTYNNNSDGDPYTCDHQYKYNGKTCQGWFPNIEISFEGVYDEFIFYAHPELIGTRTNQLPEQITGKHNNKYEYYDYYYNERYTRKDIEEETADFTYTLDKDKYVESCTITYKSIETSKYSFIDKNGDGVITSDERNIVKTETDIEIITYTFRWE